MKFIAKGGPPHAYAVWCKRVAGTGKEDYRELPRELKAELLAELLAQQGWICAYTMKRVEPDISHVEHIKPESLCRAERRGTDLNYQNLVACFPAEGMERRFRYGAQLKDNWWEDGGRDFISPLHRSCETRFSFDIEGSITATSGCREAERTIQILGLDHPALQEERRNVIQEFIYGERRDDPLSPAEATAALGRVCRTDARQRLHAFCIAIHHALRQHLVQLQKLARKRSFARAHRNERKAERR